VGGCRADGADCSWEKDAHQARESVQRILDERPGGPYVIIRSRESLIAWLFYWDSTKYQGSGLRTHRIIGAAPILIDRDTGQVCPTGLSHPGVDHRAAYDVRKRHLQVIWPRVAGRPIPCPAFAGS
jgi:hypothetical protein